MGLTTPKFPFGLLMWFRVLVNVGQACAGIFASLLRFMLIWRTVDGAILADDVYETTGQSAHCMFFVKPSQARLVA